MRSKKQYTRCKSFIGSLALKLGFVVSGVSLLAGCTAQKKMRYTGGKLSFDKGWMFHLGADTAAPGTGETTRWRPVSLPHDWSIEGAFSAANPAGNQGGALPGGIGWYRKQFTLVPADSVQKVLIRFDGVYRYSKVWINGHLLGERPNGFISFDYDMTPFLRFDGRPNTLLVRVDNSQQPNSRWYTGSGINRDVWLIKKGALSINDRESFFFATVKTANAALVRQQVAIDYRLQSLGEVKVRSTVYDATHHPVNSMEEHWQPRQHSGSKVLHSAFELKDFKTWSPGQPYLYTLEVELSQGGQVMDRLRLPLGIRSFHFDPRKGFFLNGRPTKIKGVCLHGDYGVLGTAYHYSAMVRQLRLLKAMGCNAIRTAHNPPDPGMLDLCDSMGFLVMDEAFDMWEKKKTKYDYSRDFVAWHQRDLQDQIKRDRNHPSVFMWSIGNEIREQFDTSGIRLTRELVSLVKALDTTRPVTSAMTETHADKNNIAAAGALDVLGFNYKIDQYDSLPVQFPDKPLVASETVSALETRGFYAQGLEDTTVLMPSGPKQKFADNVNGNWTVSAYDNVAAYWGVSHEDAWKAVKDRAFIAGTFVWTGIDYLGEPVPYPYPARSSYYGIIDQAGLPKDIYYFYQSEWTDTPVLHIFPHWNWRPGQLVNVWCYYSQADQVELFLNGKSLGVRRKQDGRAGDNAFRVSWKLPFTPGELKAVSTKNGSVVRTVLMQTAGEPAQIAVRADTSTFRGGLGDLVYLSVQLEDQNGILVPDEDRLLHFEVEGTATLVGVNNGYQADLTSFQSKDYRTWKGKCVAVVRPDATQGTFKLHITGKGIAAKTVTVRF